MVWNTDDKKTMHHDDLWSATMMQQGPDGVDGTATAGGSHYLPFWSHPYQSCFPYLPTPPQHSGDYGHLAALSNGDHAASTTVSGIFPYLTHQSHTNPMLFASAASGLSAYAAAYLYQQQQFAAAMCPGFSFSELFLNNLPAAPGSTGLPSPLSPNLPPTLYPLAEQHSSLTGQLPSPLSGTSDAFLHSRVPKKSCFTSVKALAHCTTKEPPIIAMVPPFRPNPQSPSTSLSPVSPKKRRFSDVSVGGKAPSPLQDAEVFVKMELKNEMGKATPDSSNSEEVKKTQATFGDLATASTFALHEYHEAQIKNDTSALKLLARLASAHSQLAIVPPSITTTKSSYAESQLSPNLPPKKRFCSGWSPSTSPKSWQSDQAFVPSESAAKPTSSHSLSIDCSSSLPAVGRPLCCQRHQSEYDDDVAAFEVTYVGQDFGKIRPECVGSLTPKGNEIPSTSVGMSLREFDMRAQMRRLQGLYQDKIKELSFIRQRQKAQAREKRLRARQRAKSARASMTHHGTSPIEHHAKTLKNKLKKQGTMTTKTTGRKSSPPVSAPGLEDESAEEPVRTLSHIEAPLGVQCPVVVDAPAAPTLDDCPVGVREDPADLHDGARILWLENGLFYPAILREIAPPDVYQICVEGERQSHPHLVCQEELLNQALHEKLVLSPELLQSGSRVCAPWSGKLRAFYPGTVHHKGDGTSADDTIVFIDFDDGDSGPVAARTLRWLPQNFPITKVNLPILPEFVSRRKRGAEPTAKRPKTQGQRRTTNTDGGCFVNAGTWEWEGPVLRKMPYARGGRVYYGAVRRHDVVVKIGDCVTLVAYDCELPYVGVVDAMWMTRSGQMRARISWCYRPDETKQKPNLQFGQHALFRSDHSDENDIQTIQQRCELFASYTDFVQHVNKRPTQLGADNVAVAAEADAEHNASSVAVEEIEQEDLSNIFYVAGFYNAVAQTLSFESGVEFGATSS